MYVVEVPIAALGSERINLSPFTKGCRDQGASMRLQTIFYRGIAPTSLALSQKSSVNRYDQIHTVVEFRLTQLRFLYRSYGEQ